MKFSTRKYLVVGLCRMTAVLVVLVLPALGFFAGEAAGAETAAKTIRSAAEIDYPPFSVVDKDGRADGFAVELLRAALSAMGKDATFRTGPWAEVRGWLEKGEVQALPLVGRTPEREPLFDFTFPYMTLHGAIVVKKGTSDIWDLDDLTGRDVAVMKGDNAEEFLRREDRGIAIHTTTTFEKALRELSEGRYDAVFIQRLVALRLIQESGLTNLKVINNPVDEFRQDFCFAVTEGDRETLALLNEGLSIVMADGTYRHLHHKWFAAMELPTHRRIVVGGDHNFPPYEYLAEDGRPAGYNVDLTRAIAREVGLDIEIRLGPWVKIREALAKGEIDAIQGMFYSPQRDLTYDFTPSHAVNHCVAVVRKGEGPPPATLIELTGKRIVVQQGDIMHDFARQKGFRQIYLVDAQEDALRELAQGKHDVALVSRLTALYWIHRYGWQNLVVGKHPFLSPEYCYAVPGGQKALLAQFSEGLNILEETGEYRRIQEKWFGVYEDLPPTFGEILYHMALVAGPLLLLLGGFFLWTWSLRRQVGQKTRELNETADRFRFVFESANVGKSMTLPTGELNPNKAFAEFLGYTTAELAGKKWQDLTAPEDIASSQKVIDSLLAGRKDATRAEKRYVHRDGGFRWADVSITVRRDEKENPLYFITTVVDITDRKRAEASLRESEEYQRALIDCSPVAIYSVDFEGRVLTWNASAERIFGWTEEEVVGRPIPIVPDDRREEFDRFRRLVTSGHVFAGNEVVRKKKDGTLFHGSLSAAPIYDAKGEMTGIIAAMEDITERKASEVRVHHLNNVLRAIREVNQLIVRERDPERLIEEGCRLLVENRGYPSALIVLTDAENRPVSWATAGLASASEELAAMLESGTLPSCCGRAGIERNLLLVEDRKALCSTCPIADKCEESQSLCVALVHGKELFGYLVAAVEKEIIVDEEEQALFVEMAEDIAYALRTLRIEKDRLQEKEKARASEEKYHEMILNLMEGFYAATPDGKLLEYNREFARILNLDPQKDHTGINLPDFWQNPEARQAYLEKLIRKGSIKNHEIQAKTADGEAIVLLANARMVRGKDDDPVRIEGSFLDITKHKHAEQEREKLQDQLLQAQKMESVGRLAGGVAHDYNNMLGVILGYTEMALERVDPADPLHENLSEILAAARRSEGLTRQLLAFARRQTISPKLLDINETIENMLKMLRRLIGEDIDLFWKPGKRTWPVYMDPAQLDQVLANLCVNARDAIAGVGKITIETGASVFDEAYCTDHAGFVPGKYTILAVSDDGCGMDAETVSHLFEPFFTTKKSGEGTGLGLATIYGIVKQNEGFINVYSEPGKGSTFRIYLPRHAGAKEEKKKHSAPEVLSGSGETVLLVEDEPSILKIGVKMLENLGYRVLAATGPGEADSLAEEHGGDIHLLITDVVMPEMNGRELAQRLQGLYPDLKILFMSGYTADVIAHRGVLEEGVFFMQKPFSKKELAAKVREALEG